MRKALVLSLWLLGILFPAAWLGRYSAAYQGVFNRVFGPEWTHVFMHMLLYAILCLLLLAAWRRANRRRLLIGIGIVVLAVGFAQESLQWACQGVMPWQGVALSASLYDLGVDLTGGLLGIGMEGLWRRVRRW